MLQIGKVRHKSYETWNNKRKKVGFDEFCAINCIANNAMCNNDNKLRNSEAHTQRRRDVNLGEFPDRLNIFFWLAGKRTQKNSGRGGVVGFPSKCTEWVVRGWIFSRDKKDKKANGWVLGRKGDGETRRHRVFLIFQFPCAFFFFWSRFWMNKSGGRLAKT